MPRAKKDTSAEVNKEISFEEAMKRLDEISSKLEKGDAALDEALSRSAQRQHRRGGLAALQREA